MKTKMLFILVIFSFVVFASPNFFRPTFTVVATPNAIDPGQCVDVIATEENPSLPLFEYSVSTWMPCGRDFGEVTSWSATREHGGPLGFSFSGVDERRVVPTNVGPRFEYEQCHYTWSLSRDSRRNGHSSGAPIVTPHSTATLTAVLCANPGARPGVYDLEAADSYNFPGNAGVHVN